MKIVDIADELYRELAEPCDLSIPAISFWLRSNIGMLNNLISTEYFVDETSLEIFQKICDVDTEIGDDEKVIFKKLYMIHYYDVKVRSVLGAASTDSVREVVSDGARVRKYGRLFFPVTQGCTELNRQYARVFTGNLSVRPRINSGQ